MKNVIIFFLCNRAVNVEQSQNDNKKIKKCKTHLINSNKKKIDHKI